MNTEALNGKTALVTGANSGLGFEAAAQLAEARYGRVILACRTLEKAEGASWLSQQEWVQTHLTPPR